MIPHDAIDLPPARSGIAKNEQGMVALFLVHGEGRLFTQCALLIVDLCYIVISCFSLLGCILLEPYQLHVHVMWLLTLLLVCYMLPV